MRRLASGVLITLMISVMIISGCGGKSEEMVAADTRVAVPAEETMRKMPAEETKAPPMMSENKVVVDEDILVVLAGQAGDNFHQARDKFMSNYLGQTADEIRIASAIMKLEAARATPMGKESLMVSIGELNDLANRIEMNTVADASELDEVFARANYALANHRQLKAAEYHEKGEEEKAANEMRAAASNIERGFGWAGEKMGDGAVATINGARLVAGKTIQAPGWVISKTGRALAAVGRGVGKGIGAVGRGTGRAVGAVGDTTAAVGKGTGEIVKGVGAGTGKVVEGVTGGVGEGVEAVGKETHTGAVVGEAGKAVGAVGKGTGDVAAGVGAGAGTAVGAVGEGAGTVIKGVGAGAGEAVEAVGKGVGWVPEQVGGSIDNLGKLIQRLGKAVEPKKK